MVARLLSPADYGLMALAEIWLGAVALLAELGLGAAIIQFQNLEQSELSACFWLTTGLAATGYFVLYVSAPVIAAWFGSPSLSDVLRVVGLTLPLVAVRIVPESLLRKRLAYDKISQAEIASAVASIPLVLAMAWTGAGVWALVCGSVASASVLTAFCFWFVRWWPSLRMASRRLRVILRYSVATLGAKAAWVAYQRADALVLGKASGDVALGFYSMAMQLATMPTEKIAGLVITLASPVMAELQADREAIRRALFRGIRLVTSVTFPMCIGVVLVADDLVRVTLSDKWLPVVPLLYALCPYAAIRSVAILFPPVLMARYRARFLLGYNLLLLGILPLAFSIGALFWGAIGVALGWVTIYPLAATYLVRQALLELGASLKALLIELRPSLAASSVMVAAVLFVRLTLPSQWMDTALGRLAVMSLSGALAYAAGLLYFGGPVRGEIHELVRWLFRWSAPPSLVK